MKKTVVVLTIVLVMAVLFVMTASATKPETVEGLVPIIIVMFQVPKLKSTIYVTHTWSAMSYNLLNFQVQPYTEFLLRAILKNEGNECGDIPIQTQLSGTCEITLIPVEEVWKSRFRSQEGVFWKDVQGIWQGTMLTT